MAKKLITFYNWHSHRKAVQILTEKLGDSVTYINKTQYILSDKQIKKLDENVIPYKIIKEID